MENLLEFFMVLFANVIFRPIAMDSMVNHVVDYSSNYNNTDEYVRNLHNFLIETKKSVKFLIESEGLEFLEEETATLTNSLNEVYTLSNVIVQSLQIELQSFEQIREAYMSCNNSVANTTVEECNTYLQNQLESTLETLHQNEFNCFDRADTTWWPIGLTNTAEEWTFERDLKNHIAVILDYLKTRKIQEFEIEVRKVNTLVTSENGEFKGLANTFKSFCNCVMKRREKTAIKLLILKKNVEAGRCNA